MNLCGLTDSLATLSEPLHRCPECQAVTRIARGLCLACLLRGATEPTEDMTPADFESALDAVAVADTHWQLGNYEILEEIGRGGMGVIYRARQRHSRRIVALKRVLSYHADSRDTLSRFRREAEAAASLDHPNILPIYEVGESEEGVPYFSMKYAPGGSLQEVGPALRNDPRAIVRLIAKVAWAVQHAHDKGILHRDLKPANILLDSRGEPLVTDFGLAKWLDASSDLTRTLTVFGTPGFIAPEQAEGKAELLTARADIYSLGAILFDLLAGRPPFLGEHALSVIRQAADGSAPPLRSLVHNADKDLQTICARCLEREASARYASAGALAEDLERWLEGRSIVARPLSPPAKVWRWSRRNPLAAGAAAAVLILAVIMAITQIERRHLARTVETQALFRRSVAVLPFLNLDTASVETGFSTAFATALQEKIKSLSAAQVTDLSGHDFTALAGSSKSKLHVLGREAHSRAALGGTYRRAGQGDRVSLRLVDANSGEVMLQRSLQLDDSGASAKNSAANAAAEISSALDAARWTNEISRDPAWRDPAASDYLRAGEEFESRRGQADFDRALGAFENAIKAVPTSALARAKFVMAAIARLSYVQTSPDLLLKAERFGAEALRLNPDLPEAHRALAGLLYAKGDLESSADQAKQAIELGGPEEGPMLALAWVSKVLGRPDRAVRWHRLAKQIQERPADFEFSMADCLVDLGADEEAASIYRRVASLHPDLPEGWIGLCRLHLLQRDFEAAQKLCQENSASFSEFPAARQMIAQVEFFSRHWPVAEKLYQELATADPRGGREFYGAVSNTSALGRLRALTGRKEESQVILGQALAIVTAAYQSTPQNPDVLYRLAAIEASLGHKEEALTHLRAAFEHGRLDYRSLQLDPRFDSLHEEAEFDRIAKAMAARVASLRANLDGDSLSLTKKGQTGNE